jgi:peptide chain release factor 1
VEILWADVPPDHPLLLESGGHRLQRWDKRSNRVHASTVTVFVRPEQEVPASVGLDRRDVSWNWHSGTGPGGQNKNKTKNALRLTHRPTGVVVCAQRRDRFESEAAAWAELVVRVEEVLRAPVEAEEARARKQAVGSGAKADKRRTYRERDDSVIDHLTGATARLRDLWAGDFKALWR